MLDGVVAEELLNPLEVAPGNIWIDTDVFWRERIYEIGFLDALGLDETVTGVENIIFPLYVTNGYQGIWPDLINDADGYYSLNYFRVPALSPRLLSDLDIFYAPDLADKLLHPIGLFIDPDIIYAPELRARVLPGIVIDDDVIRASVIRRDGDDVVLLLETFSDTDIVFAASTARALAPAVVNEHFPDGDLIYAAGQAAFLVPALFNPGDIFFAPFVYNQLNPQRVLDTDQFIGPNVRTPGRLDLFVDNDIFPVPGVGLAPLAAPFISADDAFMTQVIASNPAMYPYDAVIDFTDTLYAPNVIIFQSLAPHLWPDIDAIMSVPGVILGQALVPAVFVDTDAFYVPVLPQTITPASFVATDNLFAPILIFDQSVPVDWVLDADAFLVPSIVAFVPQVLTPGAFTDSDVFPAPSIVAIASFDGTLALDGPIMPATPQPTVIFIEG